MAQISRQSQQLHLFLSHKKEFYRMAKDFGKSRKNRVQRHAQENKDKGQERLVVAVESMQPRKDSIPRLVSEEAHHKNDSPPSLIMWTPEPLRGLKIPWPIFVPSLPKSGTTSIHRYFVCGGIWSAHTFCNTNDKRQLRIGQCIYENLQASSHRRSPFEGCGNYYVWSDAGWPQQCYYPSMDRQALQAMATTAPTAEIHSQNENNQQQGKNLFILFVRRNATQWVRSIRTWKQGDLIRKWQKCHWSPSYKGKNATDDEWANFYEHHASGIYHFVQEFRSTVSFLEINVDVLSQNQMAHLLEQYTGINATQCLKHHNSHLKRLQKNPKYRQQAMELGVL